MLSFFSTFLYLFIGTTVKAHSRVFSHDVTGGHVGGKMLKNVAETQPNPNELLRRKVDNGLHDVDVHPAIPLHHFSSNIAVE